MVEYLRQIRLNITDGNMCTKEIDLKLRACCLMTEVFEVLYERVNKSNDLLRIKSRKFSGEGYASTVCGEQYVENNITQSA